jgi:hypothetical protein
MKLIEEKILLNADLCDFFIEYFESGVLDVIERGRRYGKCGQEGLVLHEDIPSEFFSIFTELGIKPFIFSNDGQVHNLLVRKYVVGDSFPIHRDNNILNYDSGDKERGERYRSYILQLSKPETYSGGDLMFENYIANSARGNCVIFDSKLPHWVSEVTEGVRYSMVFWIKKSDLMLSQELI